FVVRLDAAGPYAENLLHFLHGLGTPGGNAPSSPVPFSLLLSCGDPQRNKNYRAALFGSKKSDPVEARAAARFALTDKPTQVAPLLEHAGTSIASLWGTAVEELVRDHIRQLRDVGARQKRLEHLLVSTYQALPHDNHLASIPGIGDVTAAVLTAILLDIDRF